ncbi:ABC transporter ATP-binding protein [Streptococcus sp. SPS1]|uniref:ABC transporter ATP-binding protein n=1 Tax=Streptococcus sp. SPS1 TaxID=3018247 RepID=UPI001BC74909|nr:ABC transporter ATP-binding protein [Streptococcus sp. SPS1]MDN5027656.1 ABC transporter ATP-binding protein [Streptococcus sp. SPS1]CAG5976960.1 exported protein [Streptococcus pneumoniae]
MNKQIKTSALLGVCVVSLGVIAPVLGANPVVADSVTETTVQGNLNKIDVVETLSDNGYLDVDPDAKKVTITEKYKQEVLANTDTDLYNVIFTENSITIAPKYSFRDFSGYTKIVYTWKGYDIYLDSTTANRIVAGLGGGAALAALIPEPGASKIVAAALGTVAAIIAYNNAAGRGVIIAFVGVFPNGTPHWITSQ